MRKYFDSIDHQILKELLRRRFKDSALLDLFDGIIDSYATASGRGLPIGNLTSQFFANHYLATLDHYVKEAIRCPGYVRYMDDSVVWGRDRAGLRDVWRAIDCFLRDSLRLELKPVCLNACSRGMTFLGYRVFPDRIGLAARSRKRFEAKMHQFHANYLAGDWSEQEVARHVEPLLAFVKRAASRSFRRRVLERVEGLCPTEARTA